ncbi:MAG TPA: hypothetical protein VHS28_11115 [Chloroflexota bacterium]|nr:hypothetical protein [Chloroflexota bacterium]
MFDVISAMGGGEDLVHAVYGALGGTGILTGILMLVRPKVHLGLMVGITAFCPDSRLHRAFMEAFTVAHGGKLPPKTEEKETPKGPKKKKGKGRGK